MPGLSKNMELNALYHISHILLHQREVSLLLKEVLDVLQREMTIERATLTL